MNPHRQFRLKNILLAHLKQLGSMLQLENAINTAAHSEHAIDRRKLTRLLLTDEDVPLRISELEAIDDFLSLHGQSLTILPIFETPALLTMLAAMRQVHFLVGVRKLDRILSVSHSDSLAHAAIVRLLNRTSPRVVTEFDVVLMDTPQHASASPMASPWERTLKEAPAVVVVASPLSNPATNTMLTWMFGPYAMPSTFGGRERPPFAFVFSKEHAALAGSPFVESPAHQNGKLASQAVRIIGRKWAIRVLDKLIVSEDEDEPGTELAKTYGVILAQRRANGHICVVVAGLHGAGTHAAALALEDVEIDLTSGPEGQNGPVHLRVVEARVSGTGLSGTLSAKVVAQRILPEFRNTSFLPYTCDAAATAQPS